MRIVLFLANFLLISYLIIFFNVKNAESFVTIPAWVAFGAITTAVKLKLILVKIMFALKTMGITSIRIKRSFQNPVTLDKEDALDVLEQWKELEITIGREISFDLGNCVEGALNIPIQEKFPTKLPSINYVPSSINYSIFVSKMIGSLTKQIRACHILQNILQPT